MSKHTDKLPWVTGDTIPDDVVFFDVDDGAEELIHEELEEAVEYALNNEHPGPYSETMEVYGWKRQTVGGFISPERILEEQLEWFDEEFGGPDGGSEPTPAMVAAAEKFAEVLRAEYVPWACEVVCRIMVETKPYLEEDNS